MRRILLIIIVWFSFFSLIQASNTVDERNLMLIAEDIDHPQQITTSINSEYEVFYFTNNETPADIINKIIANRSDEKINEILLFSHGAEGEFNFGKLSLSSENISKFKTDFNSLKKVMAEEASFQIYSCNTAKGKKGHDLVNLLAKYTETTVFASNNITGKDGDWVLEVNSDNNTLRKSIFIDNYSYNLQTITDDKYAITTFVSTSEEVYEIAIDTSNGDIYYADSETDAPMYKYDLAGNRSELGIDWTGDNWHTNSSTDIEYYNGMILSTLPEFDGQLVTFDVTTFANTYPLNYVAGQETGSAVVGDFLWTTSGKDSDFIYKIDLLTNTLIATYDIGVPGGYEGLEYCEATNKLYYMSDVSGLREVALDGTGVSSEIGTTTGSDANFAIDPHGQFAYVRIGSEVHQIDLATGTTSVFITGLMDDSRFDLEFGPSSLNPGGYSLYIGEPNKILEVNSTIITGSITLSGSCTPQNINVDFTAGTFNAGNIFTAQLSDDTGDFTSPTDIGTLAATTSGTISATIPFTPYGTGFRIRVISSDPITYGFDNGTDLTLGDDVNPTIICATPADSYDADPGQCYYTVQGTELDPLATDDNCGPYVFENTLNDEETLAGAQIGVGTTEVTWIIVDNSFNISSCSYDIVVEDLVPPTITCVPSVTKSTNGSNCTYIASGTEFDATATDDHCDPILTHNYAEAPSDTTLDGAEFSVGVHTITWTATDGTTPVTCQTIITVEDITAPTLLCQNPIIQLDETGRASITIEDVTSASPFDGCGIVSTSVSPDAVDCTDIGTPVVVTVTATDNYGNTASCDATVTVDDQIAPIISCSSIEVELDENGQIEVTPEMFSGILTISGDNNSHDPGTTDFTVPVIADETITFSWSYNTDDDPGRDSFGYLLNDVYTVLSNPNETYQTGTTTVSVVAGDVFGFRSYTEDNIFGPSTTTVYDFIPGFTGQFAQDNWILTLTNSDGYAGFTPYDACGIATEDITPNTFTCADMGDNNVLYTVVDNNGNTSSCNRTVTVLDQMAPTAKCKSFVAELDASGSVTVDPDDFDDGSTDNCTIDLMKTINGAASITYTCADMATDIPITLELVDGSGNLSSCNTTVDVVDLIAPVVTGSITETTLDGCEEADAPAAATTVAELLALDGNLAITDNCTANDDLVVSNTDVATGSCPIVITRTYTVTDLSNNASVDIIHIIKLKDDTPPTFTAPTDITIYKDAACAYDADVTITGDVTDEADNCSVGEATYADVTNATDPCSIIITRTWSLVDDCGNPAAADQVQIITVEDNTPPTFTVPADITIYKDADCNYDADVTITGDVTDEADNCTTTLDATFTDAVADGSCEGEQIITRTWSLVDDCTNAAADQIQIITVEDNTVPTFTVPADITIYKDAACAYDADVTITGDVTDEADNCTTSLDATFTDAVADGSCEGEQIITRTWSLVDDCTNAAADQIQIITVEDNTAPTFTAPADITIYKDAACAYDADVTITGDVTDEADNCTTTLDATYSDAVADGSCEGEQIITRTWSLVDDCNNAAADQIQIITVEDNTAPTFTAPADITIYKDADCNYDAGVAFTGDVTDEADNCSVGEAIYTDVTDATNPCSIKITRTWSLVDDCGNAAADQVQTITVEDNTPPTAVCQDITIQLDFHGDARIAVSDIDDGSSDACSNVTLAASQIEFTCEDVGDNIVTLTVTDDCGNVSTCEATVTVEDHIAPVIGCANIEVELNENGQIVVTPEMFSDVLTISGDNNSNAPGTTDFTVPVIADETLTFSWAYTTNDGPEFDSFGYLLNGVYTMLTDVNDGFDQSGTETVNVVAGDVFGFRSYTSDNIFGPSTTTVYNFTPGFTGQFAEANWTLVLTNSDGFAGITPYDACGIASDVVAPNTFTCADLGDQLVTHTVVDIHGNTSSCTPIVTVVDHMAPIVKCKPFIAELDDVGSVTVYPADFDDGSTDNCTVDLAMTINGAASITYTCADIATGIPITLKAVDGYGNESTCETTLEVADNTAPVITCVPNTIKDADAGVCTYTVQGTEFDATATDNCSSLTPINSLNGTSTIAGEVLQLGDTDITWTADDGHGQIEECHTIITVEDHIYPVWADAPTDMTVECDGTPGHSGDFAAWLNSFSGTDNCGTPTVTNNSVGLSDGCGATGTETVTFTLTDGSGNSITQDATFTIEDNTPPTAVCQNISVDLDPITGLVSILPSDVDGGSTDNCTATEDLTLSLDITEFGCFDLGDNDVVLTVTDECGNISATCNAIVTVVDATSPVLICPDNKELYIGAGCETVLPDYTAEVGIIDVCGVVSVVQTPAPGTVYTGADVGVQTIEFAVTDHGNNVSYCSTLIDVIDEEAFTIDNVIYTNSACYTSDNASIVITTTGGPSGLFYSIDGTDYTNTTGVFTDLAEGVYTVSVKNTNDCITVWPDEIVISQPDELVIDAVEYTDVTMCYGNDNATIDISVSGGTPDYLYSVDGGASYHTLSHFENLAAGDYDIMVSDEHLCEASWPITITIVQPDDFVINSITVIDITGCYGDLTGEIHIDSEGATGVHRYSIDGGETWYTNEGHFTGLAAGLYDLKIQDGNGCYYVHPTPIEVMQPELLVASDVIVTDVTDCFDNSNGTIEVLITGGTPDYTYSIDGGATYVDSPVFENLTQGDYQIFVQDASGCISEYANNPVTVGAPTIIAMTVETTDVTGCSYASDGSITVAATGGTGVYEYTVDGGTTWSSDPLFANLIAGSYTVMTKDNLGCEQAYAGNPVVILAPDAINITLVTSINADCYGVAGGNITITADGGNGDLSYSIDGGISFQVLNVFVSLPAGVYNVMVKDDNNCEVAYANNPVIISEPEAIVISDAVTTDVSCDNSILGSITITASGGNGNLTYSINNGEDYYATNEFTDLIADTYIVRVMDENGCMILYDGNPVVVEQLGGSVIVINKTPDYGTICVGETVSLEAIAEDAVTYTWEDGSTDAFREVTSDVSGTVTYTVTVVNESGCISEESIDIFYDECLGLPETGDDAMTINIYPNPNTGEFTLELNGVSQEIKISIIDFAGRLIIEQNVIDFTEHKIEKKFDLSDYERGVYFLRIIQGEKISYQKVVIQ